MQDLILYVGLTLAGYFFGAAARHRKKRLTWAGRVQTVAILIMVLGMGIRMGANQEVIRSLGSIGLYALVFTITVMFFSVLFVSLCRRILGIGRDGSMEPAESAKKEKYAEKKSFDRMTFLIIGFVAAGILAGYFFLYRYLGEKPWFDLEQADRTVGMVIKIGLCILLFFIGLDLGTDGTAPDNFKKVGLRIFLMPAAVIAGTFAGGALISLALPLTFRECMMIGAGFGWYTLAPGIIMENGYLVAGAVSFMHNVMRELFSIILIPLVAQKIGFVETIGLAGSPDMDVCLPIVERATNGKTAVYSFVTGAVLSMLVPVLVPLIV